MRENITVPDALYVVLARRLGAPLVTGDLRLAGAPKLGIEVLTHLTPATSPVRAPVEEELPGPPQTEQERVEVFNEVFLHSGWSRWLPEGAVVILGVLIDRPLTPDELQEQLDPATADGRGLDSSAWDPVHQWTDEELMTQRAEFADSPFASTDEDPATAAEVMVEEAELRRRRFADVDEAAASFDLAPVRTLGELVDLMVACRVLLVDEAGRYELNAVAPLPAEVLPLHPDAVAREDQLRWYRLHEPTAQAVIRLFKPNDGLRRTQLQASLRQLAAQVEADVESVRAGVTNLLTDGDFFTDVDVSTVGHDQPFELTVDWDRFALTRFSVSREAPLEEVTTVDEQ